MSKAREQPGRIRQPSQRRSRESLSRIYAATNALLQLKPFDQITVGEIATAAKVSVGTLYHRFPAKDDLLWKLYESYIAEARELSDALYETANAKPLTERIMACIELVQRLFGTHRGTVKSLLLKYRMDSSSVPKEYHTAIEKIFAGAVKYLKDGCPPDTPMAKISFSLALIMAASREHLLFNEKFPNDPTTDAEHARLLCAAVRGVIAT